MSESEEERGRERGDERRRRRRRRRVHYEVFCFFGARETDGHGEGVLT